MALFLGMQKIIGLAPNVKCSSTSSLLRIAWISLESYYGDSTSFVGLEKLNAAYYTYADAYRQRILDSLETHPERLSNLLTIYHRIGTQPALDYTIDRELLQNMYQQLRSTYPGSPDVTTYAIWLAKYEEMLSFTKEVEAAASEISTRSSLSGIETRNS